MIGGISNKNRCESYSNISNKLKLKIHFFFNYQKKLERKLYKLKICTLNQISAENV